MMQFNQEQFPEWLSALSEKQSLKTCAPQNQETCNLWPFQKSLEHTVNNYVRLIIHSDSKQLKSY